MKETMEAIQALFDENRVPIYAVGDVKKMDHVRPGNRPEDFLSGAQRMVCIAVPFPHGAYTAKKNLEIVYWWNSNLYWNWLDGLMLQACNIIEKTGHSAIPVNGCFPVDIDLKGEFVGYVSMIHMAEALKIGTIGRNGLIFHSKYGPRLTMGALVTTAPLPEIIVPGPNLGGCPEGCRVCVDSCPAKAIGESGRVNIVPCLLHSGESPARFVYMALFRSMIPVLAGLRLVDTQRKLPQKLQRLANMIFANTHGMFTCINCVSKCPYPFGTEESESSVR